MQLLQLYACSRLPSLMWCDRGSHDEPLTSIELCKLASQFSSSQKPLVIIQCLTVDDTLHWSLFLHNHEIKHVKCTGLALVPERLKPYTFVLLLSLVDRLEVCAGQPDEHFIAMAVARKGSFTSLDGHTVAVFDRYAPVFFNGESFSRTVRTASCKLLVHGVKCDPCKTYRATLRTRYNRWCRRSTKRISGTTSHVNERYLKTPQKKSLSLAKLKQGLVLPSKL